MMVHSNTIGSIMMSHFLVVFAFRFIVFVLLATDSLVGASSFEPYELNGGLVSAVAGNGFCIIAADTRMFGQGGYLLSSRNNLSCRLWPVADSNNNNDDDGGSSSSRIMEETETFLRANPSFTGMLEGSSLSSLQGLASTSSRKTATATTMIGSAGCNADCKALQRLFRSDYRVASYLGQALLNKPGNVANLLSQLLYLRRGFPYYSFCVVSGIDLEEKCSKVYTFDAIGSYEQVAVATAGTGRETLQPILDRLFVSRASKPKQVEGTADQAVQKLYAAYKSVSEREIGVGDKVVFHITELTQDGYLNSRIIIHPLKQH